MGKEFLSQEEVDSLLKGVAGDSAEDKPEEAAEEGWRKHDLANQERIARGRMPTFNLINERFMRLFRAGLYNFVRRMPEISLGQVRIIKYGDFVRNLVVPTNLNLIHIKPLRGSAQIVLEPAFIFLIIDSLFGGDGRFHTRVEGREFTATEHRFIQRLLEVVFESYEKSWHPVFPVKIEHVRSESNLSFANIAVPTELVVTTSFTIELGAARGDFHVCLPYAMLEPIRNVLCSASQGRQTETDRSWVQLLSRQVQAADVELVANLAQAPLTVGQLVRIRVGDVIALNLPPIVTAEIDSIPVMECRYGVCNGQYALKVERLLNPAATEPHP